MATGLMTMIELDKDTLELLSYLLNKYSCQKPLLWDLVSRLGINHSLRQPIVDGEISLLSPIIKKELADLRNNGSDYFSIYSIDTLEKLRDILNKAERELNIKV